MRILVAGALGEVGRTVSAALAELGHDVVAASSRGGTAKVSALALSAAAGLISDRGVDLVVNASGRGDRRASDRTGSDATAVLASAIAGSQTPAVLLSTTRVLEGLDHEYSEDADAAPRSPYAIANSENERLWLATAGSSACVLRITNYFCAPSSLSSPQSLLLPWSLVTEALKVGSIGVRSGRATAREFVSAADVAGAVLCLVGDRPASRVCATVPGCSATLEELTMAVSRALESRGRQAPPVTFGQDAPQVVKSRPGWLAERGWRSDLSLSEIQQVIEEWLATRGLD